MGYKVPKRTANLVFEEEEYRGLEVETKLDISVDLFMEMWKLANGDNPLDLYRIFGEKIIVKWNLEEEDGTPIEATVDGVLAQSPAFLNVIVGAWFKAIAQVPTPLSEISADGSTLPAESMNVEEKSLNLSNFSKPSS